MIENETARRALLVALGELREKRVWQPEIGVGSFITINFGESRVDSSGVAIGEYYLWVFDGRWTIRRDQVPLATSDDLRPTMERAVAHLDGESVLQLSFNPAGPSLAMQFTGDLTLWIEPTPEPDMEHWILYLPDGFVIVSGPGDVLVHRWGG